MNQERKRGTRKKKDLKIKERHHYQKKVSTQRKQKRKALQTHICTHKTTARERQHAGHTQKKKHTRKRKKLYKITSTRKKLTCVIGAGASVFDSPGDDDFVFGCGPPGFLVGLLVVVVDVSSLLLSTVSSGSFSWSFLFFFSFFNASSSSSPVPALPSGGGAVKPFAFSSTMCFISALAENLGMPSSSSSSADRISHTTSKEKISAATKFCW